MELPEFPLLGLLILLWETQRQVLSQEMRCDGIEIAHYILQQHHCEMTHTRSRQHLTIISLHVEKWDVIYIQGAIQMLSRWTVMHFDIALKQQSIYMCLYTT